MAEKRTFIAIDISAAARRACAAHIDHLRSRFENVRVGWERPEKLHVTLKFLGNTDESILPELEREIAALATKFRPFGLRLRDSGVFPSRSRPRILWLGLVGDDSFITSLNDAVQTACARLGFETDGREFRPHVTIGRIREPQHAIELAGEHLRAPVEPVEFQVGEIVVYESKLQPTGSVYSPLCKASLTSCH